MSFVSDLTKLLQPFFLTPQIFRDYKKDWERIRMENAKVQEEARKEKLRKAAEGGSGDVVPMVSSISAGREIADIYLKHPGNESSDDDEGTENTRDPEEDPDEIKEAESFKSFLAKQKNEQDRRATSTKSEPSTSKGG